MMISGALIALLGLKLLPLPPKEDNLTSLSNNPLPCNRFVEFSFCVGAFWKSDVIKAKVIKNLPVPLLLSLHFLDMHHIVIDSHKRSAFDRCVNFDLLNPSGLPCTTGLPTHLPQLPITPSPLRPAAQPPHQPLTPDDATEDDATPEPPLAGYLNPAPILATIQERIETLALQTSLEKLDAEMRQKHANRFPTQLPDVVNELPDHIYHCIKLKNLDLVMKQRAYATPKKYHKPWKRVLDTHLAAGRIRPSLSAYSSPAFCIPKH